MTRTEALAPTIFLNRLFGDEGTWPDAGALLDDLASAYGLHAVGLRWPAEGAPTLDVATTPPTKAVIEYRWLGPNGVPGVLWVQPGKKNPAHDDLQLLANVLGVAPALQPWLGPAVNHERTAQRLADAAKVAGRLAHDFDNVFQGVLGFTALALERVPQDSLVADHLREVQQATDSGMRYCVQLHQLSRAGTAKPFPGSVANAINAEVQRIRQTSTTALDVDGPSTLPLVAMDEGGLRLLVGHLLNNAVEASAPSGTVHIHTRVVDIDHANLPEWLGRPSAGSHVEIVIRDSGSGIAADVQRRLFVEPIVTTKFRHRGLSLAVVYRMLDAHRGGVRVESAVGRGTAVTVILPLAGPMFRNH